MGCPHAIKGVNNGRKNDGKIRCSFCGKTQDQVNRLISGPNGALSAMSV